MYKFFIIGKSFFLRSKSFPQDCNFPIIGKSFYLLGKKLILDYRCRKITVTVLWKWKCFISNCCSCSINSCKFIQHLALASSKTYRIKFFPQEIKNFPRIGDLQSQGNVLLLEKKNFSLGQKRKDFIYDSKSKRRIVDNRVKISLGIWLLYYILGE